jgi:Na+/proline symporter
MVGIGLMGMSFAKRNVTTEDYFVGGRSHKEMSTFTSENRLRSIFM